MLRPSGRIHSVESSKNLLPSSRFQSSHQKSALSQQSSDTFFKRIFSAFRMSCTGELIHDSFHKKTNQAYFTSPWRGD
ncbi:hypothetical protein I312_103675 [Cryptococcus bacillisporus CA1280]|uniref:uncharacterized protein n=1 Tax=Cryptococcus bacillisporus CA1280 TaxID=1296109 RepID=UPI00336831E9